MEKLSGDKENKIVVLVGNGFDIQILKHFKSTIDTSYPSFYNFLSWKYAAKVQNNVIIQKMKVDKLGKIIKAPEFGGRESLPLNTMQSFIGFN